MNSVQHKTPANESHPSPPPQFSPPNVSPRHASPGGISLSPPPPIVPRKRANEEVSRTLADDRTDRQQRNQRSSASYQQRVEDHNNGEAEDEAEDEVFNHEEHRPRIQDRRDAVKKNYRAIVKAISEFGTNWDM